ncbi:hypothetical protein [Acidianus sp. HS-5]|uniref:hypothetical protein n=1 Tax=Acidianus sp. HS-5 TaxID=2886040 RepID=UPI001F1FCD01|nr:hypothetical protein [Acidianus sp. HS-5]BDC17546.1 hypothetical protein HS5_04360 [Acidianus sp. HS-5]
MWRAFSLSSYSISYSENIGKLEIPHLMPIHIVIVTGNKIGGLKLNSISIQKEIFPQQFKVTYTYPVPNDKLIEANKIPIFP